MTRRTISLLLVLSGATGLVYEVVWSKVLADVLGNSGQAHAIVLATFMGGLAAGAWLFGGLADRVQRPLLIYAGIELFVGLYALVFPWVQAALEAGFLRVAPAFSEDHRAVPKLLFAALTLLLPTVAMGGTMPAMLKHATRTDPSLRATLAHLYAVNSFGAAAGAWLAGTVWIPSFGLAATSRGAGLLNLTLAAVSAVFAQRGLAARDLPVVSSDAQEARPRAVAVALAGLFIGGFVSMIYEVGWIRLVTLTVGASTYAFTWIVTAFILGLSLGSLWESRRPDGDSLLDFGRLQVALAAAVSVSLPLYLRAPYVFVKARAVLARSVDAFPAWQGLLFLVPLAVMLVPTFVMGAAFPLGARVVARHGTTVGRRLGWVWAANTLGTVLGALLGGLVLMPRYGLESLFTIALGLGLLGGGAALVAAGGATRRLWPVLPAAAAVAVYLAFFTGWAPVLAQLSPFRVNVKSVRLDSHAAYLHQSMDAMAADLVRDDTFATVVVGHSVKNPAHRFLLVNGKPDASTGKGDQVTQTLLGELGPLLAPTDARKVLVVGAGAGVSVAASLAHPVEQVDLVEISPAVLEAARYFSDINRHALDDPRLRVHVDDARTFLALAKDKYDVVVSEPSNPWVSGISSLFTKEFFDIVDAHLTQGGVLVQWIHTYEMSDELVRLVVRTLMSRFPQVSGWQGGDGDLLLIASRRAGPFDLEAIGRRLQIPTVREDLAHIDVSGVDGLLALEAVTAEELRRFAGEGPLNRDDLNLLEYRAPVAFFADAAAHVPDSRRRPSSWPGLTLSRWLAAHPLDGARMATVTRAVASGQLPTEPLSLAAAAGWLRLDGQAREPRVRLASTALALGDFETAEGALATVTSPEEAQLAITAAQLRQARTRSPWHQSPVRRSTLLPFAARDPAVARALEELCAEADCVDDRPVASPAQRLRAFITSTMAAYQASSEYPKWKTAAQAIAALEPKKKNAEDSAPDWYHVQNLIGFVDDPQVQQALRGQLKGEASRAFYAALLLAIVGDPAGLSLLEDPPTLTQSGIERAEALLGRAALNKLSEIDLERALDTAPNARAFGL